MDCNSLFLCCISCLHSHKGCCSDSCKQAERVRPYRVDGVTKPFRKMVQEPVVCRNPAPSGAGPSKRSFDPESAIGAPDLSREETLLPFSEGGDLQETSLPD